jgi:hypothetical protein
MSVTPKFFQNIMSLIPESGKLWELVMEVNAGYRSSVGELLYFTNSRTDQVDPSLLVGFSVSRTELESYGCEVSPWILTRQLSLKFPLAELRAFVGIANDEVLKNSFDISVGFNNLLGMRDKPWILSTKCTPRQLDSTSDSACFVAQLQYLNCSFSCDELADGSLSHRSPTSAVESQIEPPWDKRDILSGDELLLCGAMLFDSASGSSGFISHSVHQSHVRDEAAGDSQVSASTFVQPSSPSFQHSTQGSVRPGGEDIPLTPPADVCRTALSSFDELWM